MKKLLFVFILTIPVFAFAQTEKKLIEQAEKNWTIYLQTKQLDKAVDQYTNDAVFYSPDGKSFKGKKAIGRLYKTVMKTYNSKLKFYSNGITVTGDAASDSGSYTETMQDATTRKSLKLKGSYLIALQKQKGDWKISRIMWTAGK
ncbi:MAG TPA: nuclear transport factor 2 family protein [Mucilaginibacter sp.]|nr:nuclear transport factor 2 family protein [Mucilaginibacter sp.]